jgi:hypothetical protein
MAALATRPTAVEFDHDEQALIRVEVESDSGSARERRARREPPREPIRHAGPGRRKKSFSIVRVFRARTHVRRRVGAVVAFVPSRDAGGMRPVLRARHRSSAGLLRRARDHQGRLIALAWKEPEP